MNRPTLLLTGMTVLTVVFGVLTVVALMSWGGAGWLLILALAFVLAAAGTFGAAVVWFFARSTR